MSRVDWKNAVRELRERFSKTDVILDVNGVEVIKNPSGESYSKLKKEFFAEHPDFPAGEPYSRTTYDFDGNQYLWRSDLGMHKRIEAGIDEMFNTMTDQNGYFDVKYSESQRREFLKIPRMVMGEDGTSLISINTEKQVMIRVNPNLLYGDETKFLLSVTGAPEFKGDNLDALLDKAQELVGRMSGLDNLFVQFPDKHNILANLNNVGAFIDYKKSIEHNFTPCYVLKVGGQTVHSPIYSHSQAQSAIARVCEQMELNFRVNYVTEQARAFLENAVYNGHLEQNTLTNLDNSYRFPEYFREYCKQVDFDMDKIGEYTREDIFSRFPTNNTYDDKDVVQAFVEVMRKHPDIMFMGENRDVLMNVERPSMELMEMQLTACDDGHAGLFICQKSESNKFVHIDNLLENADDDVLPVLKAFGRVAEILYENAYAIQVDIDRTTLEMKAELSVTIDYKSNNDVIAKFPMLLTAEEQEIIQAIAEQQIDSPLYLPQFDEGKSSTTHTEKNSSVDKSDAGMSSMKLPDFDYEDLTDKMSDLSIFLGNQYYRFDMDVQNIADTVIDLIQPLLDGTFDCKDMKTAVTQMDMLVKIMDNKGFLKNNDYDFDWLKPSLKQLSGYTCLMDEKGGHSKKNMEKSDTAKKKETVKEKKGEDR